MKNQVDVKMLLRVCSKVKDQGEKTDKGFQLEDLILDEQIDGYNVTLKNDSVSVDLNFHNTYHFHTGNEDPEGLINQTTTEFHQQNESEIQAFVRHLKDIDERY